MDMHEKDEQLLRSFCDERCLKDVTYESYATAIGLYSRYHKKPFYQLLEEAEKEEREEVKWKHSKLRARLLAFRNHLMKKVISPQQLKIMSVGL